MEERQRDVYRPRRPGDRRQTQVTLTLKQIGVLVGANAAIALVISIIVTLTLGRSPGSQTAVAPTETPAPTAASAQVSATPAPSPSGETVYVVKAGDSLSAIAFQYGLSIEELMAANDLTDPDMVYIGQRLVIPVPGTVPLPSATAALVATTAASTPLPTNTRPAGPDLRIESVNLAPEGGDSIIVLTNWGTWARLKDWTMDDGQGHVFTFPDLSLFQGGSVNVHTTAGTNTEVNLYWGTNKPVLTSGTTLTLKDAAGAVVATYQIP